jgi:tetratricopeptide (TPR) repeat protein
MQLRDWTLSAWRGRVVASVILAAAVVVAFLPSLDNAFVSWDDPGYVLDVPQIQSLNTDTVAWAMTTLHKSNWHPLQWLTYAVDFQWSGFDPFGYHLTNLVLHVLSAVLLFWVLIALTGAPWRSLVVAALFALHPMRVESVAWISERKDVLCTFFWIATMGAYARYARERSLANGGLVVLGFLLALMSKPMAATLPMALLLLDYWPLRRLSWKAVAEKVPLVLAVVLAMLATVSAQSATGMEADHLGLYPRLANVAIAYVRYIQLTFWPDVAVLYPHVALDGPPLQAISVVGATLVLAAISLACVYLRRAQPALLFGWLWYLGTLVPVVGFVQLGRQGMADRYSYVPHIGLLILCVWGIYALPLWQSLRVRQAALGAVAVVLLVFGVLTFNQTQVWRNSYTLWQAAVDKAPEVAIAHQALGLMLRSQGRLDDAAKELRRAAELRDNQPYVHQQLADVLVRLGDYAGAATHYARAFEKDPANKELELAAINALISSQQFDAAEAALKTALARDPSSAQAQALRQNLDTARAQAALARQ